MTATFLSITNCSLTVAATIASLAAGINVSVHWGIISLNLVAIGRLVMSSNKVTP